MSESIPCAGETPGAPVLAPPSPFALRQLLEEAVLRDLIGPVGGPEEELDESRVSERYLVGMLAAPRSRVDPGLQDTLEVADETPEDGPAEPTAPPPADTLFPSSFGLTCCVDGAVSTLRVTARWGWYRRAKSDVLVTEKTGEPKTVWKRTPVEGVWTCRLREGLLGPHSLHPDQPEVMVRGQARRRGEDWIVTLFLVNGQATPARTPDSAWLFQPELVVEGAGERAVFRRKEPLLPAASSVDPAGRREQETLAMLYRRSVEFAAGHGVGVHWDPDPADPRRAMRVATRVVPIGEAPQQTPPTVADNPDLAGLTLDMKELAETPPDQLGVRLRALSDAYTRWIAAEFQKLEDPEERLEPYRARAQEALAACERARVRIGEGLALLAADPRAAEAFRFANRAMWLQRIHTLTAEAMRHGEPTRPEEQDRPENRSWRPFQLAFLLLNLPGVTDLGHPDRNGVADLLWFPTGGGKTEAYLGLAAYTLALRRLRGDVAGRVGESGVAVLMRYTLRLLTLQQFQRAAALMCACEAIRREALERGDDRWGHEPFRIGLWVGMRTTPNTTTGSEDALARHEGRPRGGAVGGGGTPVQLVNCPWCGLRIDPGADVKVEAFNRGQGRTLTYCGDKLGRCLFSQRRSPGEGLPVVVVDEEIYRRLPCFLIATVDKFAQMPWKGETAMLFGRVTGRCPRHGFVSPDLDGCASHPRAGGCPAVRLEPHAPLCPPDLIIQDELHLISGPLGTLVGLYETAVDELCAWEVDGKRVLPKVIASTATIRRAGEQVQSLFTRRVEVFPPHGTGAEDSFFSLRRAPGEAHPGRRYLGICATGKRFKAALIRVYVAQMAAAQQLYEKYGRAADPWMTLVGYFGSMRELGGMRRLVDDEIRQRLRRMDERGLAQRRLRLVRELTSRIPATDIPEVLDLLEAPFDPALEAGRRKKAEGARSPASPTPVDVLLATNMISVGVDVRRLGLMVVAGQPKVTAEYIQATSRVGRSAPGLVCTVFNWGRPRDLSHYERFEQFHATFYQHVEALSVTPFAARALDRGLAGVLTALVRLGSTEFNRNDRAGDLVQQDPVVERAVAALVARAEQVTGAGDAGADLRGRTAHLLEEWCTRARRPAGGGRLHYQLERGETAGALLQKPGLGPWDEFTCLNSLRDVEPSIALILDDRGLDDPS